MTIKEIIEVLCGQFYGNFANEVSSEIIDSNSFDELWYVHVHYRSFELKKSQIDKVAFRSSYVIETIYLTDFKLFRPHVVEFFKLISTVENHSMMRHYAKICTHLLKSGYTPCNTNNVANSLIKWTLDPKIKVAVKIWAIDSLFLLEKYENWISDYLPDLLDSLSIEYKASIACRMKKWKLALKQA